MVSFVTVRSPSLDANRIPSPQFYYLLSLASFDVGIDNECDNPGYRQKRISSKADIGYYCRTHVDGWHVTILSSVNHDIDSTTRVAVCFWYDEGKNLLLFCRHHSMQTRFLLPNSMSLASFDVGIDNECDNPSSKTDIVQRRHRIQPSYSRKPLMQTH